MPLVQLISEQLLLAVSAPPHISIHRRTITYSAFWKMRHNRLGLNIATSTASEVLFRATIRIKNLVRMHCRYQETWFTASRASQCYKGITFNPQAERDICFCFNDISIFLRPASLNHTFSLTVGMSVDKMVIPYLILHKSSNRPSSSCGRSSAMAVSAYILMILWPARRAVSRTNSFSSASAWPEREVSVKTVSFFSAQYTDKENKMLFLSNKK